MKGHSTNWSLSHDDSSSEVQFQCALLCLSLFSLNLSSSPTWNSGLPTGFPLSTSEPGLEGPWDLCPNPSSTRQPCPRGSQNHLPFPQHMLPSVPLALVLLWPKLALSILFTWLISRCKISSNGTSFREKKNTSLIEDVNFLSRELFKRREFFLKGSNHSKICFGTVSDNLW